MKNVLKGFNYFLEASRILADDPGMRMDVEILLFGKSKDEVARLLST